MSTPPFRIIDRIRWRLGIQDPLPHPKAAPTPIPKPAPAAGMKEPGTISRILTHGLERDPGVYGSLPFSKQEVQRSTQEGRNEREEYEKEVTAPIQSYNNTPASAFSVQMSGLPLLDQAFVRRIRAWEQEQKTLLTSAARSVDEILPNARGRPPPPIKLGNAL